MMGAEKEQRMVAGLEGRQRAVRLAVSCLGSFMVLLDVTIGSVALPTIQSSLHASLSDLQWVVDAYTLPFAVFLLTAGTVFSKRGSADGSRRLFRGRPGPAAGGRAPAHAARRADGLDGRPVPPPADLRGAWPRRALRRR